MAIQDLRKQSVDDLKKELLELLRELFNLRMQRGVAESGVRPHQHKKVRRNIARIKTLLRERELEA